MSLIFSWIPGVLHIIKMAFQELDVVVHAYNPSTRKVDQEDLKFQAISKLVIIKININNNVFLILLICPLLV
jgi:hypothetical protein